MNSPASTNAPRRPYRLVPIYRGSSGDEAGEDDAAWIAYRLRTRFAAETVRTLEVLAIAEANRLSRSDGRPRGKPAVPPGPDDALHRSCLRIARRALAGTLDNPIEDASRYHRAGVEPAWARGLSPVAEVGGFVFYG